MYRFLHRSKIAKLACLLYSVYYKIAIIGEYLKAFTETDEYSFRPYWDPFDLLIAVLLVVEKRDNLRAILI
jgi:hypothetical protein